jgi:hypothetical protein
MSMMMEDTSANSFAHHHNTSLDRTSLSEPTDPGKVDDEKVPFPPPPPSPNQPMEYKKDSLLFHSGNIISAFSKLKDV